MEFDNAEDFQDSLDELSSAEDFLTFFDVPFDQKTVHINRLHIMQRFHDYLDQSKDSIEPYEEDPKVVADVYKKLLTQAYLDFVESDAITEKVFKVFKNQGPQSTFVSVDALLQK